MHKVFGTKEPVEYKDRTGAYLIPICNDCVGVVKTPKGYFLLGGGLNDNESDEACIRRECLEEAGYTVMIGQKLGSAETYYQAPVIGYFHPIQTYYAGTLLKQIQSPTESDHTFLWVRYEELKSKMYLEMQNWAVDLAWEHKNT